MEVKNITKQNILGVWIDNLSKIEVLEKIKKKLSEDEFHQIATVNPEFILEAGKNEKFREILNSCDLNIADGFGIKLAFLRYGEFLKCRLSGADMMLEILRLADERGLGVFLACRKDGLSTWQETREAILKIYPKLTVGGENIEIALGKFSNNNLTSIQPYKVVLDNDSDNFDYRARIVNYNHSVIFCNFGAPRQEIFINSLKNDKIRLAMGVGGSFDYLTGKLKRAPQFMRQIGLEWLWRLVQEPRYRWKRIFRAAIIFPIKVIFKK